MSRVSLFLSFLHEHGLELPEGFMNKISAFCELLLEANKSTNLVSKNDSEKLLTRHVADSLIFAWACEGEKYFAPTWADIGSGAGFPAVPLCLYFPHIKFFAIECRRKRHEFLDSVKQKLDLQNLDVIFGRAENSNLRNMDFVSCRAVGSLKEDFELAKTLLKKGGCFLTVKSKRIIDEQAGQGLPEQQIHYYRLPQEEMEYALVKISTLPA